MVVLVDPMPSRSSLVQLISRVQRKPFGVCVPRETVLCMAFLNAQKYQKATPEVRHSLLRRDMGDPVANVVAALQAHARRLPRRLRHLRRRLVFVFVVAFVVVTAFGRCAEAVIQNSADALVTTCYPFFVCTCSWTLR